MTFWEGKHVMSMAFQLSSNSFPSDFKVISARDFCAEFAGLTPLVPQRGQLSANRIKGCQAQLGCEGMSQLSLPSELEATEFQWNSTRNQ